MKSTHIALSLIVTAGLLVSCSDKPAKAEQHKADAHDSHQTSTHESSPDGLVLNNGEKWEMDEHTRSSFAQMAGSFLTADHISLEGEGLKQVGAGLQTDLDGLIKGCTMTGEAHNQLHVYLTGYIPAVQALSESGKLEDAKKVKHYLEIYDDYLE